MAEGQLSVYAPIATEASIRAAANAAIAAGVGTVLLPVGSITLTSPLPLASGVRYVGVEPVIVFQGSIPDTDWTLVGGTILVGDGTFQAFSGNTTSKGSPDVPFWDNALANCGVENIGFSNFTYAIQTGAQNNMGVMYSTFRNLYITGATQWGLEFQNFMHCKFERIWVRASANGMRFTANVANDVLATGNSVTEHLFVVNTTSLSARGIVFESVGTNAQMDLISGHRIQVNFFRESEAASQSATFTNASTSIGVSDGTKFPVGMPVSFSASGNGFLATQIYFVLSQSGNAITLGNSRSGSAIASTGTTGLTIRTYGFPNLEIIGTGGAIGTTNMTLTDVDLEGHATCSLYLEGGGSNRVEISSFGTSYATYCVRGTQTSQIDSVGTTAVADIDGASSFFRYGGQIARWLQYTGSGQWYDSVRAVQSLSLTNRSWSKSDLHVRSPNSNFLYPDTPIGQKITTWDADLNVSADQGGVVTFTDTTPRTYTLPTITDDNVTVSGSYKGFEVSFVNLSRTVNLTVNTNGTQTFNNISGKTSYTLTPGQSLRVVAAKGGTGGVLCWAAFPSNGVT